MMRKRSVAVAAFAIIATVAGAEAASSPQILIGKGNQVPACVTPEHLMGLITKYNKSLSPRLRDIASNYKRHGEELHVRWDYAFYQMIVETNYLKFATGSGRQGDVAPGQNNFAGLGATGHRQPGESFADVDTGVLAHLQHVRLYSGNPVENPVAERTKLVTDLILPWAQSLQHPVTFADLTHKWAPNGHSYADSIEGVADLYRQAYCNGAAMQETASADDAADVPAQAPPAKPMAKLAASQRATAPASPPQDEAMADDSATLAGPALKKPAGKLAMAAKIKSPAAKLPAADVADQPETVSDMGTPAVPGSVASADAAGEQPAQPVTKKLVTPKKSTTNLAVAATITAPAAAPAADSEGTDTAEVAANEGDGGATEAVAPAVKAPAIKVTAKKPAVMASAADMPAMTAKSMAAKPAKLAPGDTASTTTETTTEDAASNTVLASIQAPANIAPAKNCKVFTASYGGGKSLLIQSMDGDRTRFTALTVNEVKADQQAKAFINVYAKGGQKIAEFGTQNEALTKAFQLCPEG